MSSHMIRITTLFIALAVSPGIADAQIRCGGGSNWGPKPDTPAQRAYPQVQSHGVLPVDMTLPQRVEELEATPPRITVRKVIRDIKVKPWDPCAPKPPEPPKRFLIG